MIHVSLALVISYFSSFKLHFCVAHPPATVWHNVAIKMKGNQMYWYEEASWSHFLQLTAQETFTLASLLVCNLKNKRT